MQMPGLDPGMMGGAPPPGGGMGPGLPGGQPDPSMDLALSAMSGLSPKSPNPTQALQQVDKALDMAHQLITQSLTQVGQWNPKLSKDLHTIARQLMATKMEMKKESPLGAPPDLMMGMGAGGPGGGGPMSGAPPAPGM